MKYLKLCSTDPYRNLAIEEYLFLHAEGDVFMLWQNEPTVVIGRNQNAYAEVNREYTESRGIHIARRITGGGAVYHDLGNLNYTFISSGNGVRTLDFAAFTAPIVEALGELGAQVALSGRNDLEIDGRKISGNAQYAEGGRVLHHGTLLFDTDLDVLAEALIVDEEKIKARSIRSTRSRVANLREYLPGVASAAELAERILEVLRERYGAEELPLPESEEIDALAARNSSHGWLYPERGVAAGHEIRAKRRYPFGTVEVKLSAVGELISSAQISGDFFGTEPIAELERLFVGARLSELPTLIRMTDVGAYIYGMSTEELTELIK